MTHVPDSHSAGELVVRNGKHRGARLPLKHPVTLIGSAEGCDVRLTAEGVQNVHCIVAQTPAGPVLRTFGLSEVSLNGQLQTEGPLEDGDELKVGPCVFQVAWVPLLDAIPDAETLPAEASQLAEIFDERERQLAERERNLTEARAAFRRERDAERDQLTNDREETDRLNQQAKAAARDAAHHRERARRLAPRFVRRLRERLVKTRTEVATQTAKLDEARGRFSAEVARFKIARTDFEVYAASTRERLEADWAALDAQRKRFAAERTESDQFFTRQEAAIEARRAELAEREKEVVAERAKWQRETDTLRREAAGLEARVQHARVIVDDLERRREQLHTELLATPPKVEAEPPTQHRISLDRANDRDLTVWAAELDSREFQANQVRTALANVKSSLEREAADLHDRRRVMAEQLAMLAAARVQWQIAEANTVAEMEVLAQGLSRRERELDVREQRLIRADARRRDDAYELWQLRLRLESWQTKLAVHDVQCAADRDTLERELQQRVAIITRRESEIETHFNRWEKARDEERRRLRAELQLWADDRTNLVRAAEAYDRQAGEVVAELMVHAARAMATEELLAESASTRRFEVMRRRWEKAFAKRGKELAARKDAAAAEMAKTNQRLQDLHQFLDEVARREAEANDRIARAESEKVLAGTIPAEMVTVARPERAAATEELIALRAEVERMANVLLEARIPEQPDPPETELPWGADELDGEHPSVLPFVPRTRAA